MISVVINTYEGAAVLPRALRSVLDQGIVDLEIVVADDGSPTGAPTAVVAAITTEVEVVTHPNAGLSAARNLGARNVHGDFVLFLDDDDELVSGALETLGALITDGVGIVSGGVEVVEVETGETRRRYPVDLGPELDHEVASYLAGSFAMARDVFDAIGGFDADQRCNHQRELFFRAVPWCVANGRRIVSTPEPVLRMHRQPPTLRPRNEPERLQRCLEHFLIKHRDRLARNPRALASTLSSAGVAAARRGDLRAARRHLRDAIASRPLELANVARLLIASLPPLARRVWG